MDRRGLGGGAGLGVLAALSAGLAAAAAGAGGAGCQPAQTVAPPPRPTASQFYNDWGGNRGGPAVSTPGYPSSPSPYARYPSTPGYPQYPQSPSPYAPRPQAPASPPRSAPTPPPTAYIPQPPAPANPRRGEYDPDWVPNASAEAGRRRDMGNWRYVVIHHSDSDRGGAEAIRRYHMQGRGWKDLGYDFVIGNGSLTGDGEIEVGGRWERQEDGAHAGIAEFNKHGIGICIVGDLQEHPPTPAQMRSLARLVKFLCARYGIPMDRDHVIGHGETGRPTNCPGRKFNWNDLMRRLNG
jgi:hypothetical protein